MIDDVLAITRDNLLAKLPYPPSTTSPAPKTDPRLFTCAAPQCHLKVTSLTLADKLAVGFCKRCWDLQQVSSSSEDSCLVCGSSGGTSLCGKPKLKVCDSCGEKYCLQCASLIQGKDDDETSQTTETTCAACNLHILHRARKKQLKQSPNSKKPPKPPKKDEFTEEVIIGPQVGDKVKYLTDDGWVVGVVRELVGNNVYCEHGNGLRGVELRKNVVKITHDGGIKEKTKKISLSPLKASSSSHPAEREEKAAGAAAVVEKSSLPLPNNSCSSREPKLQQKQPPEVQEPSALTDNNQVSEQASPPPPMQQPAAQAPAVIPSLILFQDPKVENNQVTFELANGENKQAALEAAEKLQATWKYVESCWIHDEDAHFLENKFIIPKFLDLPTAQRKPNSLKIQFGATVEVTDKLAEDCFPKGWEKNNFSVIFKDGDFRLRAQKDYQQNEIVLVAAGEVISASDNPQLPTPGVFSLTSSSGQPLQLDTRTSSNQAKFICRNYAPLQSRNLKTRHVWPPNQSYPLVTFQAKREIKEGEELVYFDGDSGGWMGENDVCCDGEAACGFDAFEF